MKKNYPSHQITSEAYQAIVIYENNFLTIQGKRDPINEISWLRKF